MHTAYTDICVCTWPTYIVCSACYLLHIFWDNMLHSGSDGSLRFVHVEEMIRGLTQVPWERIDVSFRKSTQRYVAHNTIQASS